jgi:hypothetical protein
VEQVRRGISIEYIRAERRDAALAALAELEEQYAELERDRDSWRRVAREYETALADRSAL